MLDLKAPVTVAAVQMESRIADVAFNLNQVEKLAVEAFENHAKIVALPEFFTTPVVFDERLSDCSLPESNDAIELLRRLARRYSGYIGGSMLLRKGGDVYNTYVFVQPDGKYFTHNKDLPTMWENAFYIGGDDDGILQTEIGPVGAAVCWELIRTQTIKRLKGQIQFAMTGSSWWTVPDWNFFKSFLNRLHDYNYQDAVSAPTNFAKLLGVPILHAIHMNQFKAHMAIIPGIHFRLPYNSFLTGESQIVDSDGSILARRTSKQGMGIVIAKVVLKPGIPTMTLPNRYWIPKLRFTFKAFWHHQRTYGKWYYKKSQTRAKNLTVTSPIPQLPQN